MYKFIPSILICLFLCLSMRAIGQKAKNLVYNGDLELVVDSLYFIDHPIKIYLQPNEIYWTPPDTNFNLTFDNPQYRLRSLEHRSMANAGKVGSCFDRAKYDVKRNDLKILKLVTGRSWDWLPISPPPLSIHLWQLDWCENIFCAHRYGAAGGVNLYGVDGFFCR